MWVTVPLASERASEAWTKLAKITVIAVTLECAQGNQAFELRRKRLERHQAIEFSRARNG